MEAVEALKNLVLHGQFDINKLKHQCEELELNQISSGEIIGADVYCILLATYLLTDDLNNSRFLWKRVPLEIKQGSGDLQQLWKVGTALWKREAGAVAALLNHAWPSDLTPLTQMLVEKLRRDSVHMFEHVYAAVPVSQVAATLAFTPEETVSVVTGNFGWIYESSTQSLIPKRSETKKMKSSDAINLEQLADLVMFLEK